MVPLAVYISRHQPNLLAGWSDFRSELARYLGYGGDSTQWTDDEKEEMNRDIQEAYRWILYPHSVLGDRTSHVWSFLEVNATLSLSSGDYDYTLPADFGSFVGQHMFWSAGESYERPYRTNETTIISRRMFSNLSARPECFAIRWRSQVARHSQRQEVIFYPTPDTSYTLLYKYAVMVGPLSKTNPYPVGGPRVSQLLMEAVKAIGEAKKNGARGDQWGIFETSLQAAIMLDRGTNTETTVGMMRGAAGRGWYGPSRDQDSAAYYFGPYVNDSSYVLET